MGGAFAAITAIAIIGAFVVASCATDGCHQGFFAKVCTFLFLLIVVAMAINYYIIGALLIYPYDNGS